MNRYKNSTIQERNIILIDSIYKPYRHLWEGYLGDENAFTRWLNETAFRELTDYNDKAFGIDLLKLNEHLKNTAMAMDKLTGHRPKGRWYIFYGPKWTNLGGFPDGSMLIDLANKLNNKFENIVRAFPHELNHQIFSTAPRSKNQVLSRVLDEGFACYVSHIYYNSKYTILSELGYTAEEYNSCVKYDNDIFNLFMEHYASPTDKTASDFANRSYRFNDKYPAALGYYIGFKIVENYVHANGKESWKDIYELTPEIVLKSSK
ncbi:hypothetical protein WSM22_41800 [Cytophagales bacterium WSM2-2]|nr:hypothetical protein WSM22_41800 [Cytophagales bacterium WSM2-2]